MEALEEVVLVSEVVVVALEVILVMVVLAQQGVIQTD
jgi:hypothetical protein